MNIQTIREHDTKGQRGIRSWIRFGESGRYPAPTLHVEAYAGKPVYPLGIGFEVRPDEEPFKASLHLWPFSLYVGIDARPLAQLARRIVGMEWDAAREVRFVLTGRGAGIGDGATIRWNLWTPSMSWSRKTPRWRHGWWSLPDAVFGRTQYRNETLSTHAVTIPMPERGYDATVTLERATWTRPRLPFWKLTIDRADVDIPGGIPKEGKGENAWDCGEDATFGISMPAASVAEAIGKTVESVLRDRMKYGGSIWHRREHAA